MRAKLILFMVTVHVFPLSSTFPVDDSQPRNSSADIQEIKYLTPTHQSSNLRTAELINQQPENVRHIIATEQRNLQERQDALRQVKKEKSIGIIDGERFPTLEELRSKCQHFARLFGLTQSGSSSIENYANSDEPDGRSTIVPINLEHNKPIIEVTRRPVFIRNKQTFIQKNNGGFYVTVSPSANDITTKRPFWSSSTVYPRVAYTSSEYNTKPTSTTSRPSTTSRAVPFITTRRVETTTTTAPPKIKIKYTKFEPVILQKTILTDGRVMYHWHRSLPTSAVDLPAPIAPIATPVLAPTTYEYPPVAATMPLSQRNLGSVETSPAEPITTSTTTTEKSSWLFVPFSSLFGGSREEETTTTENNTTPPSTTSKKNIEADSTPKSNLNDPPTEDTKPAQLKLIVPVHYDNIDSSLSAQNNRIGYLRKTTNGAVPPPSLQVIKTVAVPQSIPRYSLGYTGAGYGLSVNNGMSYGETYSPEYMNYQAYSSVPLERENKRLDDVSL